MAVPVTVLTTLGELALSPKVQDFTAGLVKNVYGRIMPSKTDEAGAPEGSAAQATLTLETLADRLDELPTREELVTSFAVLQAELDRQNQFTRRILMLSAAIQTILLASIIVILLR